MFKGVATALITPFNSNGVDFDAFARLIESQIEAGIDALVVLGTTGEPATMTHSERVETIKFAIKQINKRVPVIVGTGCNCTATAVENSIEAENLGADMLLVVTPYYNKCTQKGLIAHYSSIANAVNIPIIAYNVPGRTGGVNIAPSTIKALSAIPNIVAVKEASGNMSQIIDVIKTTKDTDFSVYSGDDALILPIMSLGADGLISVASNVIPSVMVDLVHSAMNGNYAHAQELFFKYNDLFKALFIETNPIPVKFACHKIGLCENILRLPLTPLSEEASSVLLDAMYDVKLI